MQRRTWAQPRKAQQQTDERRDVRAIFVAVVLTFFFGHLYPEYIVLWHPLHTKYIRSYVHNIIYVGECRVNALFITLLIVDMNYELFWLEGNVAKIIRLFQSSRNIQ